MNANFKQNFKFDWACTTLSPVLPRKIYTLLHIPALLQITYLKLSTGRVIRQINQI